MLLATSLDVAHPGLRAISVDYDDIVMTQSPRTMDKMCFIYVVL